MIQKPATHTPRVLEFERLLDSEEGASLLRIHPKTLQRMAREGKIAGTQIGRVWRFRASELDHCSVPELPGREVRDESELEQLD